MAIKYAVNVKFVGSGEKEKFLCDKFKQYGIQCIFAGAGGKCSKSEAEVIKCDGPTKLLPECRRLKSSRY